MEIQSFMLGGREYRIEVHPGFDAITKAFTLIGGRELEIRDLKFLEYLNRRFREARATKEGNGITE